MMIAEGWWKELGCALVVGGLLVAAPPQVAADGDTVQWAVLVYVEDAQDLEELSDTYQQYLDRVAFGEQVTAAAQLVEWVGPASNEFSARRYLYNQAGRRSEMVRLSATSPSARLANLIKWGMDQTTAEHYALVVAGHGQIAPVLPTGGSVAAKAGRDEIGVPFSARDLREGLIKGLSGAQAGKIEIVFLDCCYGVTLEVAAGLRPMADYLVGSPGLMYSPGLPWDKILSWLAARPEASAHTWVRSAVQAASSYWQQEEELAVSLTVVDLSRVEAICQRMNAWVETVAPRMAAIAPELTLARSRAESWGPGGELVDLGGFMTTLSRASNCAAVAQQARWVRQSVEQAVLASYLQGPLGPSQVRDRGLAVFFPLEVERWPEIYQWPGPGGSLAHWRSFLSRYLNALQGSVVQQTSWGRPG